MEPSDRGIAQPKESTYYPPRPSDRSLVVNTGTDSVKEFLSNTIVNKENTNTYNGPTVSRNPKRMNLYKGPTIVRNSKPRKDPKGSVRSKPNPKDNTYNTNEVKSNPNNINYKGPDRSDPNPNNIEYKTNIVKQNPNNKEYKGPDRSPDSVLFKPVKGNTLSDLGPSQSPSSEHYKDHYYDQGVDFGYYNKGSEDAFIQGSGRTIGGRGTPYPESSKHFRDHFYQEGIDLPIGYKGKDAFVEEGGGRTIGGRGTPYHPESLNPPVHGNSDEKQSGFSDDYGIGQSIQTDMGFNYQSLSDIHLRETLESNKIYSRERIQRYEKFNRFGFLDPYYSMGTVKEYLFFTKPDLHIVQPNSSNNLIDGCATSSFFGNIVARYPKIITQLQSSAGYAIDRQNPFMTILSNCVRNTLDLPSISAREIDTAANAYGTSIAYRGSGYKSDEAVDVSLEFEDTKWGDVYMLSRTYEEYSRLKELGLIKPPPLTLISGTAGVDTTNENIFTKYHEYRELHDRFSIYKFIVDEDFETILFWSKCIGCYFNSVPRDAYSDLRESGGLKFTLEIKVPFIRDNDPIDLYGFNSLINRHRPNFINDAIPIPIYSTYDSGVEYKDGVTNTAGKGMINGSWVTTPYIHVTRRDDRTYSKWMAPQSMEYIYKLKWY